MSGGDTRLFYIEDQFYITTVLGVTCKKNSSNFKTSSQLLTDLSWPIHETVQTARQPIKVSERFLGASRVCNTASVLDSECEHKVPQNQNQSTPNTQWTHRQVTVLKLICVSFVVWLTANVSNSDSHITVFQGAIFPGTHENNSLQSFHCTEADLNVAWINNTRQRAPSTTLTSPALEPWAANVDVYFQSPDSVDVPQKPFMWLTMAAILIPFSEMTLAPLLLCHV